MLKHTFLIAVLLLPLALWSEENKELAELLESYKQSSDLSNITKRESAGLLNLYTRDDLEKMQANYLMDVLRSVPGLYFARSKKNYIRYARPSTANLPLSSIRLYINDHDMSSSSFGSAFMIWGDMPLGFIDHIEIYRGTSSIEFGNENASLVIKVYTKDASREVGGKVQLLGDDYGSMAAGGYYAQTLPSGLSYFAYLQRNSINQKVYHNYYNGKEYDFESDRDDVTFYANLFYDEWTFEAGNYSKTSGNFVGLGIHQTPTGGEFDSRHTYVHATKEFAANWKLQISYDNIDYDRNFIDENGIKIYDPTLDTTQTVLDYATRFRDDIASVILEKRLHVGEHELLFGGFYKYKGFRQNGAFSNLPSSYYIEDSYRNALHLYSFYIEDTYDYDMNTKLVASVKGDFYRYEKSVDAQNEYIMRLGVVKNIAKSQFKLFYTDSYVMVAPFQLYNDQLPYKTDPHLKYPSSQILTASLEYKMDRHSFELQGAYNKVSDSIIFVNNGYTNSAEASSFTTFQAKYSYKHDLYNRADIDIFYGKNSTGEVYSPEYGANFYLFNTIGKWDIYNELLYKCSYPANYGVEMEIEASLNWSSAVKYHYSKDLALGVKWENILDDSYQILYKGLTQPIQSVDRKLWVNMEYTF